MIDWQDNGLIAHNLIRPEGLANTRVVIDIGSGLRPCLWNIANGMHLCVEPHDRYAERLEAAGYDVVRMSALSFLRECGEDCEGASVYLLDVIEHMPKDEGHEVIALAVASGARQVVIFTPVGFLEQSGPDPWGLGGEAWQQHRSGWLPEEFPGWTIQRYGRGFFAIYDRRQ